MTQKKKPPKKQKPQRQVLGDGMAGRTADTVQKHNESMAQQLERITGRKPKRWGDK